ncbi:MAG: nucleoside deaminase [Humidesulfovibrio sp.]|nr:nucleoside deaminase [Humidesulfovibrio sp.]
MSKRSMLVVPSCILMLLLSQPASAETPRTDQPVAPAKAVAIGLREHEPFIRQAFELAVSAGKHGNHTFGAVLVHQGKVILTSENTVCTDNDVSRHAEINLLVNARRKFPSDVVRSSTVYTSAAPCPFCSAALAARGISRIVYGVSYEAFNRVFGTKEVLLPCDSLYRQLHKELTFIGPVLEGEGLLVFKHWPESDPFKQFISERLKIL